ncbi:transmembrane protein, putative [Medicago truncatula]|uniref:Transmembrane protein, putative n=1 Tax=Medicago truncatula TaxID=3880 RepID=A0A072VF63_MEDTR|nr:transmembrane protein, putative [Medicago truncatula]
MTGKSWTDLGEIVLCKTKVRPFHHLSLIPLVSTFSLILGFLFEVLSPFSLASSFVEPEASLRCVELEASLINKAYQCFEYEPIPKTQGDLEGLEGIKLTKKKRILMLISTILGTTSSVGLAASKDHADDTNTMED